MLGHAVLHVARAGARRAARSARRRLQPGRDALSRADRRCPRSRRRRRWRCCRSTSPTTSCRRASARPSCALPPEADRIVLRAMAKSPADRYASAAEVQADLERALAASRRRAAGRAPAIAARRRRSRRRERAGLSVARSADRSSTIADLRRRQADARGGFAASDLDDVRALAAPAPADCIAWSLRRRRCCRLVAGARASSSRGRSSVAAKRCTARARAEQHAGLREPARVGRPVRGSDRRAARRRAAATSTTSGSRRARPARRQRAARRASPASTWCSSCSTRRGGGWRRPTRTGGGRANGCSRRRSGRRRPTSLVREVWVEGTGAGANVADPYTLTARWGPPEPGWEMEPNDWEAAATPSPPAGRARLPRQRRRQGLVLVDAGDDGRLIGRVSTRRRAST